VPVLDFRDKLRRLLGSPRRLRLRGEHKPPELRTILIVDGSESDRRATARRVTRLQYRALEAATADEALERLADSDPSCVLLAIDLPDRSGLDLLTEMREAAPDLEVVMLTRDWRDGRTADAMRRGAVAYLAKPFSQDDLRELLR
jgi:DNA-binding NtrC family response regulator